MKKVIFLSVAILSCATAFAQSVSFDGANVSQFQSSVVNNGAKIFNVPLVGSYELIANANRTYTMTDEIRSSDMALPAERGGESKDAYAERLSLAVKEALKIALSELKAKALFMFAEQEGADLIVSPTYAITTKSSDESKVVVEIRIKGFPARYTSIRPLQASDSTLVRMSRLIGNDHNSIDMEVTQQESHEVNRTVDFKH